MSRRLPEVTFGEFHWNMPRATIPYVKPPLQITHAEYLAAKDLELADSLRKQGLLPSSIVAAQTVNVGLPDTQTAIEYWDNLASFHGYSRYPGETNEQLKERMHARYNTSFPPVGVRPKVGMHARYKLSKRVGVVTAVDDVNEKLDVDWEDGWKGAGFPWREFEFACLLVAGIPIFHSDGVSGETVVYHDERKKTLAPCDRPVERLPAYCRGCGNQSKHAESETSMGLCFDCFEARR